MKKFIVLLLLFSLTTFMFSQEFLNLPELGDERTNIALMDYPLISGIYSFSSMTEAFMLIAMSLSVYACFFLLIFTSFKLWAGTTEGKKAFVDILSKIIIYNIIIFSYIPITNGILELSAYLGIQVGGGALQIENTFVDIYANLLNQVETGMNVVKDQVFQQIEESRKKEINPEQLNKLLGAGWTEEDIARMAQENGYTMLYKSDVTKEVTWGELFVAAGAGAAVGAVAGTFVVPGLGNVLGGIIGGVGTFGYGAYIKGVQHFTNGLLGYKDASGKRKVRFGFTMSQQNKKLNKELKNKMYNENDQKKALERIAALTDVLVGEMATNEAGEEGIEKHYIQVKGKSSALLKNVSWSPFITGKDNISSVIISPSKIIKTIVIMCDATAQSLEIVATDKGFFERIKIVAEPSSIFRMILFFIYKTALVIGAIIIMVEYSITILEFFLVRAVAFLLIPMLFIDATKSYAMNLLRLALSYFFKIMVTIMLCFWTLTFYLDTIKIIFLEHDASSLVTLAFMLMTLIIGLMFSLNGPKIASTVLSGSPSMGAGDLARGISNTIRTANHARQLGGAVAKGAAGFAQKGVKQGMGAVARFQGAKDKSQQVQAGLRKARKRKKYTGSDEDIASAGRRAMVSSLMGGMKQDIGDKVYKALTGNERPHLDDEGYKEDSHLKVGQKFFDPKLKMEKIATMEDVKEHAKGSKESIQKMTQKAMNKHKRSSGEELKQKLKQKLNGRRPASYEEKFPNG